MRRAHQIAGLAFLALALFLGWHATRLSYYSALGPGPGFFPIWLCGILAALSLVVLVGATRPTTQSPGRFWPDREAWTPLLAVIAGLVFVVLTIRTLGYTLTMLIFYLWLVVMLGSRNLLIIGAVTLIGALGTEAVFSRFLKQALPAGTLWM